jgi:hypothetical protein
MIKVFGTTSSSCLGFGTRRDAMGVQWNSLEPLQIGIVFFGCLLLEMTPDGIRFLGASPGLGHRVRNVKHKPSG